MSIPILPGPLDGEDPSESLGYYPDSDEIEAARARAESEGVKG